MVFNWIICKRIIESFTMNNCIAYGGCVKIRIRHEWCCTNDCNSRKYSKKYKIFQHFTFFNFFNSLVLTPRRKESIWVDIWIRHQLFIRLEMCVSLDRIKHASLDYELMKNWNEISVANTMNERERERVGICDINECAIRDSKVLFTNTQILLNLHSLRDL